MVVPRLTPTLRRAVHLAQNFNWCRVAHDTWKLGQCRAFNRRPNETGGDEVTKKPRPKTEPVPKITLVSPDNSTTVTVLEVAQRLAKRRNFTLIKVSDIEAKTQRPLYKLVNNTGVLEEAEIDTKAVSKSSKGNKLFYMSAKIAEHDLLTKTKNVVRLLNKGHKVKVVITLDDADGGKMQKLIEDAVRNDGSVQRMPSKKNVILLLISPIPKKEDVSVDHRDKTDSSSVLNEGST